MNRSEREKRQHLIKRFLHEYEIRQQSELVKLLNKHGFKVTQATISRDMKALQIVKIPSANGGYRYSLPVERRMDVDKKLAYALKASFVSLTRQDKLLFLKTSPGNAPAISALIYQMHYAELFGNVGDDDSIFIVARTESEAVTLQEKLLKLVH